MTSIAVYYHRGPAAREDVIGGDKMSRVAGNIHSFLNELIRTDAIIFSKMVMLSYFARLEAVMNNNEVFHIIYIS